MFENLNQPNRWNNFLGRAIGLFISSLDQKYSFHTYAKSIPMRRGIPDFVCGVM